jgi:hypothetical protein
MQLDVETCALKQQGRSAILDPLWKFVVTGLEGSATSDKRSMLIAVA